KVGTLAASERVVIGDGDIPLRRICHALADAGYAGWWDIELLGSAIEAEGYESVVPRALKRFRELWTGPSPSPRRSRCGRERVGCAAWSGGAPAIGPRCSCTATAGTHTGGRPSSRRWSRAGA